MRTLTALGTAAVLGLAGAACDVEPDPEDMEQPSITADTVREEPMEAAIPAIQVDSLEDGGVYLTDANGRALYMLEGEPQDSSTCYDECAEEWPPYLTSQENPTGAGPVQQNLIGTIQRTDGQGGQWQLTYGGYPLYYYHDDSEPGDVEGHQDSDDWGEWYLVTPEGRPLEAGPGDDS